MKLASYSLLCAAASLFFACSKNHPCRPNTVLLTLTCGEDLARADHFVITKPSTGNSVTIAAMCPGLASVEIDIDGYVEHGNTNVTVTAMAGSAFVGSNQNVNITNFAAGCTAVSQAIGGGTASEGDASVPRDAMFGDRPDVGEGGSFGDANDASLAHGQDGSMAMGGMSGSAFDAGPGANDGAQGDGPCGACPNGYCSQGKCVACPSNDGCTIPGTTCSGTDMASQSITCIRDANGCLIRSSVVQCKDSIPPNSVASCMQGLCGHICSNPCAPGIMRCGPNGGVQTCSSDICPSWGAEVVCMTTCGRCNNGGTTCSDVCSRPTLSLDAIASGEVDGTLGVLPTRPAGNGNSFVRVGDQEYDHGNGDYSRVLLAFDISNIAASKRVVSATLRWAPGVVGACVTGTFSALGNLLVEPVAYGPTLSASARNIAATDSAKTFADSDSFPLAGAQADVSAWLQKDVASNAGLSEYRLRFAQNYNSDGALDACDLDFGTFKLDITYRDP